MPAPRITVVGSVNLDLVVRCETLPRPGETVSGATLARFPGGKGANQAVACARLGARVTFVGAVGRDAFADEALAGLREAGVELDVRETDEPTGVALITVDAAGETTIVVSPGANGRVGGFELAPSDAVLCQQEIPDEAVIAAWEQATGMFCLNAAPARRIAVDPDLAVVNRFELESLARTDGLVALTLGAEGAVLLEDGEEVARATPPQVEVVDGTAAGDAFTACLLVSLLEGRDQDESLDPRLRRRRPRRLPARRPAVAADRRRDRRRSSARRALCVDSTQRRRGDNRDTAGVSIPIILDCDPGHDDAIALLLALASPEVELLGVTTVHGNQTLAKTTANALRVLDLVGRTDIPVAAGADRPLERELVVASHVHGDSGLDGPTLPPARHEPLGEHAVDFMERTIAASPQPVTLVPTGPLTNIALLLERTGGANVERIVSMGGAAAEGNMTPAAEFNIWADPEAAQAVYHAGIDITMIGLDVTHLALTTPAIQERLRAAGTVGVFVADLVDFFAVYHRETYGWDGAPIHDAVAVAHVIQEGLVTTIERNVEIELESDLCRGRTVVDRWRRTGRPANAHVGVDLDADGFFDLLVERIGRLG